jgi:hypothetical protein
MPTPPTPFTWGMFRKDDTGLPIPGIELSLYSRETPPKPAHRFSANTPACQQHTLQEHRLSAFINGPASTVLRSTSSAAESTAAHRARAAAQLEALQSRLP